MTHFSRKMNYLAHCVVQNLDKLRRRYGRFTDFLPSPKVCHEDHFDSTSGSISNPLAPYESYSHYLYTYTFSFVVDQEVRSQLINKSRVFFDVLHKITSFYQSLKMFFIKLFLMLLFKDDLIKINGTNCK